MSTWTDEETRELIKRWPTHSATQIAMRLHRQRSSVCGKVNRLRQDGVLPRGVEKHFEVPPVQPRPQPVRMMSTMSTAPTPPPRLDGALAMRPCALLDLDDRRCRWPLGDVHRVATLFCGGSPAPGRSYCAHHVRLARAHSQH